MALLRRLWGGLRKWSLWRALAIIVLVLAVIGGCVVGGLIVFHDWPDIGIEPWRARLNVARDVGIVLAGVIALLVAGWRGFAADRQASAAQIQVDAALKQSDTAQTDLRDRRYQKGAEMLGSDLLAVRLAGVYALDRLAREHPIEYYFQVKRLFCSFVRFPAQDDHGARQELNVRDDIQQIMWALRDRTDAQRSLDSQDTQGFDFTGADLQRSQLIGFRALRANFSHTRLSPSSLVGAYLPGATFAYADASNVEFSDAFLEGAMFFMTILEGSDFRRANLQHASFSGSRFHSARFGGADMSKANLRNADLTGADLTGVKLRGAELDFETSLKDVNLSRADLTGANCNDLILSGARMSRCDLTGAVLVGANLQGADLRNANLSGVLFGVPTYDPAGGLTQKQIDQATADPKNPPRLDGALDAETGQQLQWRGREWEGGDMYGPQPGSF